MSGNGTELVVVEPTDVQLGTLRADTPQMLLESAARMATPLAAMIEQQRLYNTISGRKHVRVEGWVTLAVMLGCTPREVSNHDQGDGTYEAVVELVRMRDGVVISRASSECGMDEPTWAGRAKYARRSMAATRATSKACRIAFSWVMTLAGYEATPAEEMPDYEPPRAAQPKPEEPAKDAAFERGAGKGKPLNAISEAQARRIVAIARATGEKHGAHGFHVVASVLKACDLPPFPPKSKMDEALVHLCELIDPGDYEAFCKMVEAWQPVGANG